MPQNVVKAGLDAPCAQRMKEYLRRVFRFVRVEFVIEMAPGMIGIHQIDKLFAQPLDLPVVQNPDARQIAVLAEKTNLFVAQPVAISIPPFDRRHKQIVYTLWLTGSYESQ